MSRERARARERLKDAFIRAERPQPNWVLDLAAGVAMVYAAERVAAERERCARVAAELFLEGFSKPGAAAMGYFYSADVARAIRSGNSRGRWRTGAMSRATKQTFSDELAAMGACGGAVDWIASNKIRTVQAAWAKCQRADWMIWYLDKHEAWTDRERRLFACWCVRHTPLGDGRTTWDLLTDKRSRNAVEIAERFASGGATREELDAAGAAAGAARDAARAAAEATQADQLRRTVDPFKKEPKP
jgi:hypothetical protein